MAQRYVCKAPPWVAMLVGTSAFEPASLAFLWPLLFLEQLRSIGIPFQCFCQACQYCGQHEASACANGLYSRAQAGDIMPGSQALLIRRKSTTWCTRMSNFEAGMVYVDGMSAAVVMSQTIMIVAHCNMR